MPRPQDSDQQDSQQESQQKSQVDNMMDDLNQMESPQSFVENDFGGQVEGGDKVDMMKSGQLTKELLGGFGDEGTPQSQEMDEDLHDMDADEKHMIVDGDDDMMMDGQNMLDGLEIEDHNNMEDDSNQITQDDSNVQQIMDNSDIAAQAEGEDDEGEVIDIDNEEELAQRGLRKIQIEGEEEEFLLDAEGNIYDLGGNFIGTTNGGEGEGGDAEADADGEGEEDDDMDAFE